MSTLQQNHSNVYFPIHLSPNSAKNTTIAHNHIILLDNSDQGSVDSDYTSLGSSKFYGNGGSTSSLHHQGRAQSFDELTTTTTTTIPTRHFNGTSNVNKLNNDPLQFVKIHPNHDLIERAQEQLTLLESRKRLQENLKSNSNDNNQYNDISKNTKTNNLNDDDDTDWSKAVENWRQKRERKRKQASNTDTNDNETKVSLSTIEPSLLNSTKSFEKTETKPKIPSPTFPQLNLPLTPKTNISTTQTKTPNRIEFESPATPPPVRNKGPAKIREIFIQKPVDVRGFGFKLDGGPAQNRPIYISTLEDGSPADKAGLYIEDEVISMNDENVEQMTFDQVRKILKERNLRGSIKMVVKTYEEIVDDNPPAITVQDSRTPSPQKPLLSSVQMNASSPPTSTTTSSILLSSTIPSNTQSPVYTFLPCTPPPSSSTISPSDNKSPNVVNQTPSSSSLNIFAPKPFRSMASINIDSPKANETNFTHSSPIEAFRKMLDPSNSIGKVVNNETNGIAEQSSPTATKQPSRDVITTPVCNSVKTSSSLIDPFSTLLISSKPSPPPLASVESLLNGTSYSNDDDELCNDSPIAQIRSSVEKQMNQLQQELLLGYPHTQTTTRDQRPISIPIDFTNASLSNPTTKTTSPSMPFPTQRHDAIATNNRGFGLKVSPFENSLQYSEPNTAQEPIIIYEKPSVPDLAPITTSSRSSTSQTPERAINELRVTISSPLSFQEQNPISYQLDDQLSQQHITSKQLHAVLNQVPKKAHYDDHSWINEDQQKTMHTPFVSQSSHSQHNNERNESNRRVISQTSSHHQEPLIHRQPPTQLSQFYYDYPDENLNYHQYDHHQRQHHHHQQQQQTQRPTRSIQHPQRDFDLSNGRQQRPKLPAKSPIRTTINSNNNRVLSVSGKLHCSRCDEELGQGSAMVIESLNLYYHIECFRCYVCNIPLSSSLEGTDVRVRSNRLHCQNCFSDENGVKLSAV